MFHFFVRAFLQLVCSWTFSGSLSLETLAADVPEPKMVARAEFQFKNAKSNFSIRRGGSKAFFEERGITQAKPALTL